METSSNKFEIIHDVVSQKNNKLSVKMLCEIAGVSRSGYYKWVMSEEQRQKKEELDRKDFEIILSAYNHRGYDKGGKRNSYVFTTSKSTCCYEPEENTPSDEQIQPVLSN